MSDETGPKLTLEALDKKRSQKRGRKPALPPEEQVRLAAEYAAGEESMRSLATKWNVSLSVVRRAVMRVEAQLRLDQVRRRCL